MKENRFFIIVSILTMLTIIVSSYFSYKRFNNIITKEQIRDVSVVTTSSTGSKMDINPVDMINKENVQTGFSNAFINVYYNTKSKEILEFDLVYKSNSVYNKTKEVDGILIKEYTYEIKKNNLIIEPEKELPSFSFGDEIILSHQKTSDINNNYEIIFRFYTNKYDQSHLIGQTFDGTIFVKIA